MSDDSSINNNYENENENKNENGLLSDEEAESLEEDRQRVIEDSNQNDGIKHPAVLDPSIELDPHIPDRDYAEFLIDTAKKTVKREDALVRQIVYTALSKDSDNPLNLAVLAMSSEGKTHAVVETLKPFEKLDLWKIGSMSPKVIVRQNGILVDSNNEPIEERIKDLKRAIRKAEEDKNRDEEDKLSDELEQTYYLAKSLFETAVKEKEESKKAQYFVKAIKIYDKYLRRTLNLEIKDTKRVYSKILTDSNVNRNTSIQEIFDSFGGSDKLAPINCLSKIAHIKDDKDTFLVEESIGKRIKDMAIFFATIIPVAVAVIQLLLQQP